MQDTLKHDTCGSIMIANPITLPPDLTLRAALSVLRSKSVRHLPVVDEQGYFLGLFSSMTLLKLLLPQSVSIAVEESQNPFDLTFMHTTIEDLRERLHARGDERIIEHILVDDIPICTAKTSLMEALNMLYKSHYHLTVIEEDSRRFLGVVTISGVLEHVR